MEYFLNEKSLDTKAGNVIEAREGMETIIQIIKKSKEIDGTRTVLRTMNGIFDIEVAEGYSISLWLKDIDKERKSLFLTLIHKSPYIDSTIEK